MTNADLIYSRLLDDVLYDGVVVTTRNSETYSNIYLPNTVFTSFPLVTVRKTAWKKAIKEMEWFLSGDERCPEALSDWWKGQLDESGCLIDGYSKQFRSSSYENKQSMKAFFDQVKFILEGLKNNPNSRRLIISMWNSGEMAYITETNDNPNTPTCCHSIIVQFFVRGNTLHIRTYQRSADMLLGVPHNWVQSWAMLMYFAYHSGLEVGTMNWMWGDAHIYNEKSHTETAQAIIENYHFNSTQKLVQLEYNYSGEVDNGVPVFKADDFKLVGEIEPPIVTTRPKLI